MNFKNMLIAISALLTSNLCHAQGIHFSQYYNAPLLLNPANTALMPDADYRVGVNYRSQWATIPVPYKTTSAYADFQVFRNKNLTNWLGLGIAFWNDKAGDGNLSLSQFQGLVAYHVQMGESSMLSAGISASSVQRKVDFDKLTFDRQWDGFVFDRTLSNGEHGYTVKTNYFDLAAGINYAFFPNENVYLKVGFGMAHITQPKESFYGQTNQLGLRPTANIDLLLKAGYNVIINPSFYYTNQKGASELLYGTLFKVNVSGTDKTNTSLILGAFHRWDEAIVAEFGMQFNQWTIMTSYDFTVSTLSPANKSQGAFEIGIMYQGFYGEFSRNRRSYNCPRF